MYLFDNSGRKGTTIINTHKTFCVRTTLIIYAIDCITHPICTKKIFPILDISQEIESTLGHVERN